MFVFNMTGYLPWRNSFNSHFDVGLPTAIPYSNVYLLCVLQAFAVIFLAGATGSRTLPGGLPFA